MHQKIQNTKRALLDALCHLMKTHPAKEITVAQLCRQANINRTTFYKYYAVPMDVLTEYVTDLSAQIFAKTAETQNQPPRAQIYETILASCRVCLDNRQIVQLYVMFSDGFPDIMEKLLNKMARHSMKNNSVTYFISGGVSAVLAQWVMQGYCLPPEEIAGILADYIVRLGNGTGNVGASAADGIAL